METKDYLRILEEEIHSTVIATVDKEGKPVTRVIDIMLADEDSLYFITANVPRNVSTCQRDRSLSGRNTVCTAEIVWKHVRSGRWSKDKDRIDGM